jgi:hypothetical protein
MLTSSARPFHELTLHEYLATEDAQRVSRHSIAALAPAEYTLTRLSAFPMEQLKALAQLWGIARNGSKRDLIRRIIQRKEFRERLTAHSLESLLLMNRKQLAGMAKEAGLFYSALSKREIANHLVAWRKSEGVRAAQQLGEARHYLIVRKALRAGLNVTAENRERYGLDTDGSTEPVIFGVPRSVAARRAPEAVTAARELAQDDFNTWALENPNAAHKANLITPGAMLDNSLFWVIVRKAYESEPQGSLFD